jgi:putative ATP-dependent endonuclease of OLD family
MFLSELEIQNFRAFGSGDHRFSLRFNPGLTALVGENDCGKTTVMDALRLVLGTTDQEYYRVEPSDFHRLPDGSVAESIQINCTFRDLTEDDRGAFAEYLSYVASGAGDPKPLLQIHWNAKRQKKEGSSRRFQTTEWRTGSGGNGPSLDMNYRFLERFLDVTKANLFFARRVVIVEGDAENILVPSIARLIGRDFEEYGVSVVNVGGVGLRRYANIFLRASDEDPDMNVRVACITDLDVMPDCAPLILGKLKPNEALPANRRWKMKADYPGTKLAEHRETLRTKASGKNVETFVANHWTLEFDLAREGLAEEVWLAVHLADQEEKNLGNSIKTMRAAAAARKDFKQLRETHQDDDVLCSHIYAKLTKGQISKAITAQYLTEILEFAIVNGRTNAASLSARIPEYVRQSIEFVTRPFSENATQPDAEQQA